MKITRADGRSNGRVIIDYVKGAAAGRLFTYAELIKALNVGADQEFTVKAVQTTVTGAAFRRLLKEAKHTLVNVKTVGYRLSYSNEHRALMENKLDRADTQTGKGLLISENTNLDELEASARTAHLTSHNIINEVHQQVSRYRRQLKKIDAAIASCVNGQSAE